ncbi:hypothetical protein PR048_005160 [Dryococelus australis]|uniref:Uncharacterized protein n=1 Tax=Dryococelus australis TaxID=614101 RepID=A0ABQ9I7F1_9NEOP|nr:hypothetical protein PR048_005160 [Dryococelus australis]
MSSLVWKIHAAQDAVVIMDSDEENLLHVLLLRRRCRRHRKQRLFGQFYTIMSELKQYCCKFHNYFRISKNSFDELLSLLKTHVGKADTNIAETQHDFLPLMMQGIDSGTVVDYHQMMPEQMDTGRCTDEFEECRMGEIRHTRLQEFPCLSSDNGGMASVEL